MIALAAFTLVACADGPAPGGAARDPATYTGSAACAECHPREMEAWRGSHHDLAMQVADEASALGDFDDATFTYGGITSRFFRRDGKLFVRTDGPDGALRDYEIAYTFGVDPLQQYLIRFPRGRLQALGIAWDTRQRERGGQRWFHLYPDEALAHDDVLHWTGRNQNWNYMCAECHSTNLRKGYRLAEDAYDTTWSELDVACEACHGPGSAHARWAEQTAEGQRREADPDPDLVVRFGKRAAWIFEPGAAIARRAEPLASRVEVETCARCHARRSTQSEDYVHGRPLMETHRPALLDAHLYHADGQILDEVYVYGSFLQSRMFAAGVTCSDCHDPHSLSLRGEGNALCAVCHQPTRFDAPTHHFHAEGSPGASCVACHMAARTYMVVDERHDHGFRVPRPDLSVSLGTPNACSDCHRDRPAEWALEAVNAWYGAERKPHFGEALHAGRRDRPHAARALTELADDRSQPAIARATALRLLRTRLTPTALPTLERALGDDDPLVRAAALEALEALEPGLRARLAKAALRDPVRGVRVQAASVLAAVHPELFDPADRRDLEHALAEYRAALQTDADRPEGHLGLGALHAARGELAEAESAYLTALRLAPDFVPAYVNLADVYRVRGREDEGEPLLRRALALEPRNADVHHALGLLLVRQGRPAEALEALGLAADLEPGRARYAYVYGVGLHSAGRGGEALGALAQAHERHPDDRALLLALATISRDLGARADAVAYARKLVALEPRDPASSALLAELESQPLPR